MELLFGHSKTDQLGDNAKYPWHLFANPDDPVMCPVLVLSMYFGCCFNTLQLGESPLFPGHMHHDHFCNLLEQILHEHKEGLHELGYEEEDIGTNSIHKGE